MTLVTLALEFLIVDGGHLTDMVLGDGDALAPNGAVNMIQQCVDLGKCHPLLSADFATVGETMAMCHVRVLTRRTLVGDSETQDLSQR